MVSVKRHIVSVGGVRAITLPKILCESLGLNYGDSVNLIARDEHLEIWPTPKETEPPEPNK